MIVIITECATKQGQQDTSLTGDIAIPIPIGVVGGDGDAAEGSYNYYIIIVSTC